MTRSKRMRWTLVVHFSLPSRKVADLFLKKLFGLLFDLKQRACTMGSTFQHAFSSFQYIGCSVPIRSSVFWPGHRYQPLATSISGTYIHSECSLGLSTRVLISYSSSTLSRSQYSVQMQLSVPPPHNYSTPHQHNPPFFRSLIKPSSQS